jgi:hypothetical protein
MEAFMKLGILAQQLQIVLAAMGELEETMKAAAFEVLEPIESIDELPEGGLFLLTLLGVDDPKNVRKVFADGVEFKAYQPSPYIPDWDAIGNLGQSDVTGAKWLAYNDGKPAWNSVESEAARAENAQFANERGAINPNDLGFQALRHSRIAAYEGPLRAPASTWPAADREVLLTARPDLA